MRFQDRSEAGRLLARRLEPYRAADALVLALPRGGVPVAWEIAHALGLPLGIWVSRKIGAPHNPELGIGAVAEDGTVFVDRDWVASLGIDDAWLARHADREAAIAARRARILRQGAAAPDVADRTVILVDDGIATGGTIRAAAMSVRRRRAARVVIAVPVAQADVLDELRDEVDEVICLQPVRHLGAIGAWYADFEPTTDDEALALLERATGAPPAPDPPAPDVDRYVRLALPGASLEGELTAPAGFSGLVIFAHGSGSSRASPRNQQVARVLNAAGLATLLFDLLTRQEEARDAVTGELRFDVELLARRLAATAELVATWPRFERAPVGYFGASTGAAAALIAAAEAPDRIRAVVSRGGRPDLAGPWLSQVGCPTLLIVGSEDEQVLELNRRALARLRDGRLAIVEGATHLFEEQGALEEVARLTASWFAAHLGRSEAHPAL